VIARLVRGTDERLGASPLLSKALRYVFPDHWSFLLGEIALYAFIVLVATGVYLTLFFEPSLSETVYTGSYLPLRGQPVTDAYASTLNLSFDVPAGLLLRQTHHWAALVFVVAIVLHLMRIVFTGAFRKPRDVNYAIGVTLLALALVEGFAGYSLPDDLLSGMGLAIAYGVALSIPLVGAQIGQGFFGGEFPGAAVFEPRLYIVHVLLLPVAIGALISAHLAIIMRQKHSQFPGPGRTEANVVGSPLWPSYTLRSIGLLLAVSAVLVLLGGLVQINPIWQWGHFDIWQGTNGAQPDWYLGWLIGSLRIMPPLEITAFGWTLVPNPFFGGVLFPTVVFAVLYAWPAVERRLTGDRARHDLLERPRENPWRTAFGAGFFTWVALIFIAGSGDRIYDSFGVPYEGEIWYFRIAVLVLPFVVFWIVRRICLALRASESHPVRGSGGGRVRRAPGGGFERLPKR